MDMIFFVKNQKEWNKVIHLPVNVEYDSTSLGKFINLFTSKNGFVSPELINWEIPTKTVEEQLYFPPHIMNMLEDLAETEYGTSKITVDEYVTVMVHKTPSEDQTKKAAKIAEKFVGQYRELYQKVKQKEQELENLKKGIV